jgi:SAM-dependent methyltransferase
MEMSKNNLPLPPDNLANRVGGTLKEEFEEQGREIKEFVVRSLPENYDFTDKRILDFGCGAGRVLRHFDREARIGEFFGCDTHKPSVEWLSESLPAYFRVFSNTELPHLPIESNYFDLVYVISVFTHLTTTWKPWLMELKRVLKPGGIALITFHNRIAYEYCTGKRFDEQNTGILLMHEDRDWDSGGPMVYHSNWWIQKHWGQFFNIDYISREGLFNWQSLVVLNKSKDNEKKENSNCPIIQPYPYQVYNPNFRGDLNITSRRSNYLRRWHGLEMKTDMNGKNIIGGWFASKTGKIKRIQVVIDNNEVIELPGTNCERKDVAMRYKDWLYSLQSGFELTLSLNDYQIGEHQLEVTATDATGQHHKLQIPLVLYGEGAK